MYIFGSDHKRAREKELVQQIQKGNEEAFERLFKRNYKVLCDYCTNIVKSRQVAEDVVQEVYAEIWRNQSEWSPGHTLRSYLLRAVKNRAINKMNKRETEQTYLERKAAEPDDIENNTAKILKRQHFKQKVHDAVRTLPDRARQVYTLHRREGYTYKEIAKIMNISVKTVERQMSRSLRKLRNRLSRFLP
jgi:RNA polymerase sigma-70 factor (ECF subfamily)